MLGSVSWLVSSKQDLELEDQVLGVTAELPQVIPVEQNFALREEFMDYCTYQLPSFITSITDIASYWHQVGKVTGICEIHYPLAKAALVIPHSYANVE